MKTQNRLFDILTLSSSHRRLKDPITILTAGVAVLGQIFPNIFGGGRKRLTDEMWLELLPGAGYWTNELRSYLKTRIHYDVDFAKNVKPFTMQFVADNNAAICPGTYTFQNPPGTNPGGGGAAGWLPCYERLLQLLQQEKYTGGTSPIGITPGGYGLTADYSTILPLAIGAVALVFLMKSKKKV
jgi:hypothetical protein